MNQIVNLAGFNGTDDNTTQGFLGEAGDLNSTESTEEPEEKVEIIFCDPTKEGDQACTIKTVSQSLMDRVEKEFALFAALVTLSLVILLSVFWSCVFKKSSDTGKTKKRLGVETDEFIPTRGGSDEFDSSRRYASAVAASHSDTLKRRAVSNSSSRLGSKCE